MKLKKDIFKISFDELTDTLYINTGRPQKCSSTLDNDFILVRSINNVVVGLTITDYKLRKKEKSWKDKFVLNYLPTFKIEYLNDI